MRPELAPTTLLSFCIFERSERVTKKCGGWKSLYGPPNTMKVADFVIISIVAGLDKFLVESGTSRTRRDHTT